MGSAGRSECILPTVRGLVGSRSSQVQSRCIIASSCKHGSHFHSRKWKQKKKTGQVVVHEAIGRVGIKVIERQKETEGKEKRPRRKIMSGEIEEKKRINREAVYFSANRRSKYRSTPITLAASTSIAARPPQASASARSWGLGRVCSLGSQVEISSLARLKFG